MGKRNDIGWRKWTFDEVLEVRRLRDEDGLTFREVGERVDATPSQCRGVYHTARKAPWLRVEDVCRQAGISTTKFYTIKYALRDARKPFSNKDVLAACTEGERCDHD